MREMMRSFKWTWVLNQDSLFAVAMLTSFAVGSLVEGDRGLRLTSYVWIAYASVATGLHLYLRKKGGWQATEPPPEVFLFWFLFMILAFVVFIFFAR